MLGAGVMGAQIAAHLVNAGVDGAVRPACEGRAEDGIVAQGHRQPGEAQPRRSLAEDAALILPANYDEHWSCCATAT